MLAIGRRINLYEYRCQIRNADTERFNSPEEVMQALQSGLNLG